nr:hypothetical protein [uncultured Rhodopila sp.]
MVSAILLLWGLYQLAEYARLNPPSFDGGLNLRVAQSFGAGHGYGLIYDSFFPFPAQTDGPLVLPAALVFRVAGVSFLTTQVINLIYVVVLVVALVRLFLICEAPLWLALFGALLCMQVPGFVTYSMNGFGEIIVLAWFLLGLVILESGFGSQARGARRFALGGMALALAYLTKVVALICVAPAAMLAFLFIQAGPFRRSRGAAFVFGLCGPVLGWECFRLYQIASIAGYKRWWLLQFGQIQAQSGAASWRPAFSALAGKAATHLEILSQMTGVPEVLLLVWIVLPPLLTALFLIVRGNQTPARFAFASIALTVSLYFVWWLLVTPTNMAWLRRILDGIVLSQCLIVMLVAAITGGSSVAFQRRLSTIGARTVLAAGLAAIVPCDGLLLLKGQLLPKLAQRDPRVSDIRPLIEEITALPADAKIFGFGWWQAPVLALFSGRDIYNFERWLPSQINALPRKFLLTDYFAQAIVPGYVGDVLASLTYRPILQTPAGSLYEIQQARPYVPFSAADGTATDLASDVDFANGDYRHKRGIYDPSGGWAWSRPDSAVMLLRSDETRLAVDVEAIPATVAAASGLPEPLHLRVVIDGCADEVLSVEKGSRQTLTLALDCPAWSAPQPLVVRFAFDGRLVPVQQLDADNRLLGFILFRVRLAH